MIFRATEIPGVAIVDLDKLLDERGFFARSLCTGEFADHGVPIEAAQCNVSVNRLRGTLRGMHYQAAPKPDPKLVRCTRGTMYDVAVDLTPEPPLYSRWVGVELDAATHRALFIPAGCAHGFLTLTDDVEVLYVMGAAYDPELARGVRWDDPAFAIAWPCPPTAISERDRGYPDFAPQAGPTR